ncbi:MAG: glycosyltransferase [Methylococcales bacterium]
MNQGNNDLPLICFLVTSLSYGGAETVLITLATNLRARGWPVKLICMIPPEARVDQLTSSGIEVESLYMHRGVPDPRAIIRLSSLLRKWKPLVLHSHMVHANLLGRIARIFVHIPVVISTAHNIDEGGRWREIAYRLTDFLADVTTNVSQAAVDRYIEVGAAPRNRIRFIPNGLNTDIFKPDDQKRNQLRDELGLNGEFVWLAVGRLVDAKDYPNMIKAFSMLTDHMPVTLLIVGQGELENELEQQVRDLKQQNRIRFLGVRQDIPQLMNAIDGYVMSSAWEGLPMVLLEAAASGKPIVATDVGGNREIVLDQTSGYIVPPGDADEITSALENVRSLSPKERNDMGKAGRQYVEDKYSIESVVTMWEDLYKEMLSEKSELN